MPRYRFVRSDNKIICLSTYAKKVVRGIAKCSPNDAFNLTVGEKLAQLRCDEKVAEKRMNRAFDKYKEALSNFNEAKSHYYAMEEYYCNARKEYDKVSDELNTFEKSI